MKNGSTTITQRRGNLGDYLAMLQHRQPSQIFTEKTHVYLVISAWCRVLWVAQIERDHYGALYWTQLMRLSRALKEKRAHYYFRHDKIILLHDNARPHVVAPVKTYLETLKWKVLLRCILQTLLLPTTTCSDRWRMACLSNTSHHMKIPKIVSLDKIVS